MFELHVFIQDDKGKFNFDESKVINPETGEPVSLFVCSSIFNLVFRWQKETEGVSVSFRCPVGIGAARRGTVNSPRLLPLMKNAAPSVLVSICVSTSKCSGISCFTCYPTLTVYICEFVKSNRYELGKCHFKVFFFSFSFYIVKIFS